MLDASLHAGRGTECWTRFWMLDATVVDAAVVLDAVLDTGRVARCWMLDAAVVDAAVVLDLVLNASCGTRCWTRCWMLDAALDSAVVDATVLNAVALGAGPVSGA